MTALRITSIELNYYGSVPSGSFRLVGQDFSSTITITEAEARQLMDTAFRFFEARQAAIGASIAKATLPNLLAAPIPDADFEEVKQAK